MRGLLAAMVAACLLLMLLAVPVFGAELTGGCVLQLRSFDGPNATGNEVDEAEAHGLINEGDPGSQSNPFEVDPKGSVDFLFSTSPAVFQNNHWAIYAQGMPVTLLAGSDDNPMDVDERGFVNLGETLGKLPFPIAGTYLIQGDLWGNNDANNCHGEGYVKILGDPTGTVPWIVAMGLIVFAGAMLLVATPYSTTWETDPNAGERLRSGPITDEPPTI